MADTSGPEPSVSSNPEPDPVEEPTTVEDDKRRRVRLPRPTGKRWGMNPEDRMRVMESCMVVPSAGWGVHFVLMMSMSVIVAVMGLSANSPALVIGAMLIAPLMTPVLGIAASIAMVLGDAATRTASTVAAATAGAIAVSYVIAGWLPDPLLTGEVLARTAPDARDLVVALAAGVAGSYATARPDVSSSLPGVAIAVALVPPLAVVGITLRAGETELALGALLLYATNLAAIVTVSTVVFVAAGFVPGRRLLSLAPRVVAGSLAALLVVVVLGVLLGSRSLRSAERSTQIREIRAATEIWLSNTFNESEVEVFDDRVQVTVTGPTELPPSSELKAEISSILGEERRLKVTWIQGQTSESLNANAELRAQTAEEEARQAERVAVIEATVDQWLGSGGDASAYELTALDIGAEQVTVSLASTIQPPDIDDLKSRLSQELGETIEAVIAFEDLSSDLAQQQIDEATGTARTIVQDFAVARDLRVDLVTYDGATLTVDLRGESPPDGVELETALAEALGGDTTINVFFIKREPVIPAPTPTPTPTPVPTPTPSPTPEPAEDEADDAADPDAADAEAADPEAAADDDGESEGDEGSGTDEGTGTGEPAPTATPEPADG